MRKKDVTDITRVSPAHRGRLRHSIDFIASEGRPIYAALGGKVTYVKQNSKVGGPHRRFWFKGNRIEINHKNDEYTAYEHLMYNGAKVKVGQTVRKGQLIGYSGNTGYSHRPHLHFEVFRYTGPDKNKDVETLVISFKLKVKISRKQWLRNLKLFLFS
jgi:murein DD-endopeptidase MepM/ murein hydrolase activator NlpD